MEPKFNDRDVVLVKKADAVDPGKIGIFVVNGEAVIKECGDGILHSLNPCFDDIVNKCVYSVKCLGEVIGKLN
jgi:repressor LexA